jgi:hypothetical protein
MERQVTCVGCGKPFFTSSPRKRSCSSTCRSRLSRGGAPADAPAKVLQFEPRPTVPDVPPPPDEPPLVTATRTELEKVGKLDTALGQQALVLASEMVAGGQSGSAVAALSKRLGDVMASLVPPPKGKPDALDELAGRRLKKAAGG